MKKILYFFAPLALLLVSCSSDDGESVDPLVLGQNESRAAANMQSFDNDFFNACCENIPEGNLAVSPLSARLFLSMFANSIEGEAVNEITAALNTADLEAVNTLSQKLSTYLPRADRNVKVAIVNSVWYRQDLTVNKPFEESASRYYNAEFFGTDFGASDAGSKINSWVKKNTNGMIDNIVDDGSMDLVTALMLNTLYYKGAWAEDIKFDKSKTSKSTFYGTTRDATVDMMHNTVTAQYSKDLKGTYETVKLPMGKEGKFEAVFVLSAKDYGTTILPKDILSCVSSDDYESARVELALPKFKLDPDKLLLADVLKSLGIKSIDSSVNTLFEKDVQAGHNIFQKTVIEVNEEGAEAAAVTGDIIETAPMPPQTVKLTFDHPFVFFINEKTSGACLFAARVNQL